MRQGDPQNLGEHPALVPRREGDDDDDDDDDDDEASCPDDAIFFFDNSIFFEKIKRRIELLTAAFSESDQSWKEIEEVLLKISCSRCAEELQMKTEQLLIEECVDKSELPHEIQQSEQRSKRLLLLHDVACKVVCKLREATLGEATDPYRMSEAA